MPVCSTVGRFPSVSRGFTLIELIIVITVLSILLGIAMPNLRGPIARNQLLGQAHELASALSLARSEAVTRGSHAGVCASANGKTCSNDSDDWASYALVFIDEDRGSDFDGAEPVVRAYAVNDEVRQSTTVAAFYFRENGFSTRNLVRTIEVCHEKLEEHNRCRAVQIAPTGAVTVRHKEKEA